MWERFSYYGMRVLLVLYMTGYILEPSRFQKVIGSSAVFALFGVGTIQATASQLFGLYTGLVYLTPLIGGILADRYIGYRVSIITGSVLMAAGHALIAYDPFFLIALMLLIVGNGMFKPALPAQLGQLYEKGDSRRDQAFSMYYLSINVGAFLAPLICGFLGEVYGWHYGFGAAAVGMLLGLLIYLMALPKIPQQSKKVPKCGDVESNSRVVSGSLTILTSAFIANVLFQASYEQSGNTINLWARDTVDRNLFGWEIPVTWFQSLNPILVFALVPFLAAWWSRQASRGTEPTTLGKMSLGCAFVALAHLLLAIDSLEASTPGTGSLAILVIYFIILTLGEVFVAPIGLSLYSKSAPPASTSLFMGVWFLSYFVGNLASGWLGSFWELLDKHEFWAVIAGVAATASCLLSIVGWVIRETSGRGDDELDKVSS